MRIKTITCHNVYNFGATLQAYALMRYLRNLGHEVEIIDYNPSYFSKRYSLWAIGDKWKNKNLFIRGLYYSIKVPLRLLSRKGKYRFDSFKRKYMKMTEQSYKTTGELRENPPKADLYIAGSDQIWNTQYENGRDPAFYLDFVPLGSLKVSYAASFSISKILPEFESFVKSKIEKFDFVSVREREGIEILESIGIFKGKHVLDPVFLLTREFWDSIAEKKFKDKYVLVYDFEYNSEIEKFVKELALKNHLKIYGVNNYGKTKYADIDYYSCGPEVFLSLIKNAEYVVANSFHSTAFSLIFEKEFFVFDRIHQDVNSRMRDLLDLYNLGDRLIIKGGDHENSYSKINYDEVAQKLAKNIAQSKLFLDEAITGVTNS